jgi:hypothetical protein
METKKEMGHYLTLPFLLNKLNLKEIQAIGKKQLHYFNKQINYTVNFSHLYYL